MAVPMSITSTANVDPYANTGPLSGNFTASPVFNKPFIDLSNPLHLAALAVAAVLVLRWKKKR